MISLLAGTVARRFPHVGPGGLRQHHRYQAALGQGNFLLSVISNEKKT
jgi:hypothetical protein